MNEYECNKGLIAFEILDQCRLKECLNKGPVISAEKCICVLLEHKQENDFGRIILPDRPIYLPESVFKVKIENDSLKITKLSIAEVSPSKLKKGHWDIEICFTFIFKIQLFDFNMRSIKVLCKTHESSNLKEDDGIKDYILGTVDYFHTVTLCGRQPEFPVMASDILKLNESLAKNAPHVLVEAKAYFIDVTKKTPEDACLYEEVLDDIYDEPVIYIYITIGILMLVKLFRLASMLVYSSEYPEVGTCCNSTDNECCLFNKLEFPFDDFMPPSRLED